MAKKGYKLVSEGYSEPRIEIPVTFNVSYKTVVSALAVVLRARDEGATLGTVRLDNRKEFLDWFKAALQSHGHSVWELADGHETGYREFCEERWEKVPTAENIEEAAALVQEFMPDLMVALKLKGSR
jgi:hypothetical protein